MAASQACQLPGLRPQISTPIAEDFNIQRCPETVTEIKTIYHHHSRELGPFPVLTPINVQRATSEMMLLHGVMDLASRHPTCLQTRLLWVECPMAARKALPLKSLLHQVLRQACSRRHTGMSLLRLVSTDSECPLRYNKVQLHHQAGLDLRCLLR